MGALIAASVVAAPLAALGADTPASFAELATYRGPDREQLLLDGARKEGRVVWYTSLVQPVPNQTVAAFKAKYPGIDVDVWAGTDVTLGTRVITEFQAGRSDVDVITGSGVGPAITAVAGAQPWSSPEMDQYPISDDGRDAAGSFVTITQYARAFAYNTRSVKPADVPTQWDDLLKPRWKGKIALSNSETVGPMMIGGLIASWGKPRALDFVAKFGKQGVAVLAGGPAAVASQVAAGEFDACYCAVHHVRALQAKKAPIALAFLGDTLFAPVQTTQFPAHVPDPHAALLFMDFLISADGGETVLKNNGYLPTHPKLSGTAPELAAYKLWVLTPERLEAGLPEWTEIMRTDFR
jgi:iron(III) transport system substrate-binding protein